VDLGGLVAAERSPAGEWAEYLVAVADLRISGADLAIGIAVIRSSVGLQPLLDAAPEDLVGPLRDVIDVLLTPPR